MAGQLVTAFSLANAFAACAPDYPVLPALRVLFGTATALTPEERVGRYVAVVAFGVTGAIAVGCPWERGSVARSGGERRWRSWPSRDWPSA